MHNPKETKVALLAGGSSSEREISLASGDGAYAALSQAGYSVIRLDPANEEDLERLTNDTFDVAFICLHGEGGEDGRIQAFLEKVGLLYTCSGVEASANCMDKATTKSFYRKAGIPTPESLELNKCEAPEQGFSEMADAVCQKLGQRCVIKVVNGGSSIGVYIVEGEKEVEYTLERAFLESDTLLVERYVAGREITDVVLDICEDDECAGEEDVEGKRIEVERVEEIGRGGTSTFSPRALPIIEIIPANDSYDYDAKYLPGGSRHICPAELGAKTTQTIQELAVQAHVSLGCKGVSRTDFILDSAGQPWALETNTIPGMTKTSLLPEAAAAAGISFPDLCVQLVEEALSRN